MTSESEQQGQTNAEIWSTRIQRELLALTTDNADAASVDQVRGMLPNFCNVQEHHLSIENGTCTVNFQVQVENKQASAAPKDGQQSTSNTDAASATTTSAEEQQPQPTLLTIVVSLDASLPKTRKNANDTASMEFEIDPALPSYPFAAPVATLKSGQACFPPGSTIQDGKMIAMDLDWTPSLHLTDAILNIALKIKESLLQQEAFHAAPVVEEPVQHESALEEVAKASGKAARGLAASIGKALHQPSSASGGPRKGPRLPGAGLRNKKKQSSLSLQSARGPEQVRIGDEIHLLEEPWVSAAHGVYSCKAIRRPGFVQQIMDTAQEREEQESFSSPTAMFRSFTQSARSVLEESFLMITETHIMELKASKLNMSTGKVSFAIPVDKMAKLKFRRQESLSLFFKPAPDDPLIYMCPDSGDAVHQIQNVLKRHGVKGKHTNAAAHRAINEALHLVQEIQTKELALKHDPTVERVNEIMDLYRQTAERFELAGDIRHEEVVTHMRKFLALPLTTSILDGSYKPPEGSATTVKSNKRSSDSTSNNSGPVPEGEVLERTAAQLEADDDHDGLLNKEKEKENDKAFEENIDNLLREAQDLSKLDTPTVGTSGSSEGEDDKSLADVAADLDAMMKEADKELAELMKA